MYGLGQNGDGVELELVYGSTAPLVADTLWLLSKMSPEHIQKLRDAMCEQSGREAVDARDADAIAFHVSGGEDGVVSSACGRNLQSVFYGLLDSYNAVYGTAPAPQLQPIPSVTPTPVKVTAPSAIFTTTGAGVGAGVPWWMWPLAGIAAYFAVTRK